MQMIKPKEEIQVRISGDRLTMCLAEEESGIGSGSSTCGSTASAEDVESPKSVVAAASSSLAPVGAWRKSDGEYFHIQVKRLKEEESLLSDDVWEGITVAGEGIGRHQRSRSEDDNAFFLPASPLGGIRATQSAAAALS